MYMLFYSQDKEISNWMRIEDSSTITSNLITESFDTYEQMQERANELQIVLD